MKIQARRITIMKSIAIVTDSNCGMSPAQVKDLGIYMLPMPFFIDDKEYLEDIDMNQSEFFQHLEQNPGCKVSTSQPTPESVTTSGTSCSKTTTRSYISPCPAVSPVPCRLPACLQKTMMPCTCRKQPEDLRDLTLLCHRGYPAG